MVNLLLGFKCEEHDNPADFFLDVIDAMEQNGEHRIPWLISFCLVEGMGDVCCGNILSLLRCSKKVMGLNKEKYD